MKEQKRERIIDPQKSYDRKAAIKNVRGVLRQFEDDGLVYFKLNRIKNLVNESHGRIASVIQHLESNGEIGRWNPEATGTTVWMIEDLQPADEETD